MSDILANLLTNEIYTSTNVAKVSRLVDRVWCILNNDDRCRALLMQKLQCVPDETPAAWAWHPVPDNAPTSEGVATDGSVLCLPRNNPGCPFARTNTLSHVRSPNLDDAVSHGGCQTSEERPPSPYPTPWSTPDPQWSLRTSEIEDESTSHDTAPRKRRRKNERESNEKENTLMHASRSCTPHHQRRSHGRESKKTEIGPNFEYRGLLEIEESLNLQVLNYADSDGLQDAWNLVDAFQPKSTDEVQHSPSDSRVKRLKCYLDFCDALEEKGSSLIVRAQVGRRFHMVQTIAELRRQKKEKKKRKTTSSIVKEFKQELFPGKNSTEAQSSWDYFCRVGNVLYKAVERYGYGVLVFPLCGTSNRSLHALNRQGVDNFLEYIGKCKPELKTRIRNLSYILPRLMTWGLPEGGMRLEKARDNKLLRNGDGALNCIFPLPAGVEDADLQPPDLSAEVTPWPSQDISGDRFIELEVEMTHEPISSKEEGRNYDMSFDFS